MILFYDWPTDHILKTSGFEGNNHPSPTLLTFTTNGESQNISRFWVISL